MAILIRHRPFRQTEEKTLQTETILEPPTELAIPKKQLLLTQLPFLNQLGEINNGILVMRRGFRGYPLKTKVSVQIDKILDVGEIGICEYIFKSLVPQRPALTPWVLENKSLLELAAYMKRAGSGSKMGF